MQNLKPIFLSATRRDEAAARTIQAGFERFRVPAGVQVHPDRMPWVKKRSMWRHKVENPRVAEIPPEVAERIREGAGDVLVLLCGSAAASSRWIQAELDLFYASHPRGIVIPVVLEGEPHPDGSHRAYEKPCFPENLRVADQERRISARGRGGVEAAVVALVAAVLGVRLEELLYHVARRASSMGRERLWAWGTAVAAGGAACWALLDRNAGFGYGVASGPEPPALLRPTSALAPPGPEPLPEVLLEPGPAAPIIGVGHDPEAARLAVNAWLDKAESHLPGAPDEAREWLARCGGLLASASVDRFGTELYRFHALLAVTARCHGDAETAKEELRRAIGFWTQIPLDDREAREEEALEILATISPGAEWLDSVRLMAEWLSKQPAPTDRLLRRGKRLRELAVARPVLVPFVDGFLSQALERAEPAPEDRVAERARWDVIRAEFAAETGRNERAAAILASGIVALDTAEVAPSETRGPLRAQLRFREESRRTDGLAGMLDEVIPELEAGCAVTGWQEWFSPDAAAAWSLRGDLGLEQGDHGAAIRAYNRAVEFASSPEVLANLLLRSGCAYRYAEDPAGAWDAFSLALPIFEKVGDVESQLIALLGQSLAAKELERPEDAESLWLRASGFRQRLGPTWMPPRYWREPLESLAAPAPSQGSQIGYDPALEEKISRVRKEIEAREADESEKGTAQGLANLQALYEELDRLLREKITGERPSLEVEVLRRSR